jgi:hypothetical protein
VASTGIRILTARKSTDFQWSGPNSLVAAEIHLGRQRAITGGWLHCNIQVVCQLNRFIKYSYINGLARASRWPKSELPPIPGHLA